MFAEATLPSACNPISVLLSPATATATMLLPLVKRFRVVSPTADQKTTEPSARVAKLPVELPVTAMTLLNPGGGKVPLLKLPHTATGPKVSCATVLVAALTEFLATTW